MDETSMNSELFKQTEELVHFLQNDMRRTENSVTDIGTQMQDLKEGAKALELSQAQLVLWMKDSDEQLLDLTELWKKHLLEQSEKRNSGTPLGNAFTSSRSEVQFLEEEIIGLKLKEMHSTNELNEQKLRNIQLETQVQATTNQLRREKDENKRLKDDLDSAYRQIKEFRSKLKEEPPRYEMPPPSRKCAPSSIRSARASAAEFSFANSRPQTEDAGTTIRPTLRGTPRKISSAAAVTAQPPKVRSTVAKPNTTGPTGLNSAFAKPSAKRLPGPKTTLILPKIMRPNLVTAPAPSTGLGKFGLNRSQARNGSALPIVKSTASVPT